MNNIIQYLQETCIKRFEEIQEELFKDPTQFAKFVIDIDAEVKKWKEVAASLNGKEITCYVKCGENGKFFGSVTSKEIADNLVGLGYDVDKRKVILKDAIKSAGVYPVEIKFLPDVTAKIKVKVAGN